MEAYIYDNREHFRGLFYLFGVTWMDEYKYLIADYLFEMTVIIEQPDLSDTSISKVTVILKDGIDAMEKTRLRGSTVYRAFKDSYNILRKFKSERYRLNRKHSPIVIGLIERYLYHAIEVMLVERPDLSENYPEMGRNYVPIHLEETDGQFYALSNLVDEIDRHKKLQR